jgi:hypothetical protein
VLKKPDTIENDTSRPGCWYRLLWLLSAALALIQVGAAVRAARVPAELAARISVPLTLELVAGLLWAGLFAGITIRLLARKSGATRWLAWGLIAFSLYNGLRWLAFTQADYDRGRLPVLLLAILFFVMIMVVLLIRPVWIRKRKTETTFDDSESQN